MTFDLKFLNTPYAPLVIDNTDQLSWSSDIFCRRRSSLTVPTKWPEMIPRWPLTLNSWTPHMYHWSLIILNNFAIERLWSCDRSIYLSICPQSIQIATPTVFDGSWWNLVTMITEWRGIWGVREVGVKGHLGVSFGHVAKNCKTLLLLQYIWGVQEFDLTQNHPTYQILSNLNRVRCKFAFLGGDLTWNDPVLDRNYLTGFTTHQ